MRTSQVSDKLGGNERRAMLSENYFETKERAMAAEILKTRDVEQANGDEVRRLIVKQ